MSIKRRRVFAFNLNTALLEDGVFPADDENLSSCIIPAGREITIYNLVADVRAAGDTDSTIELVDASDNVLAEVAVDATGVIASEDTFPIRFKNSDEDDDTVLRFKVNGTLDASTSFTVEAHMDEPDFA